MRILLPIMPDTASSLDRVMKFPNLGLCSLAARRSRFFGDFPAFRGKMLPNTWRCSPARETASSTRRTRFEAGPG